MTVKIKPPFGAGLERGHPLARGLVGAWLFNEGRGSTLWDVSGAGHTGTLASMDPSSDWVAGPHGYALDFDGTDDRVIVGPEVGINFGTANTCVIRLKIRALTGTLVGHKAYNDGGYFFSLNATGAYYCANAAYVSAAHGMTTGDEVWLGVSRQATSVTFYKNGRPLGTTQTLSANHALAISAIGCYRVTPFYATNMRCDYVYCWSRSLSASEMAWLCREPFCFVGRGTLSPAIQLAGGTIRSVSGLTTAVSSASAAATVSHAGDLPTGNSWPKVVLGIEASWLREALLSGMTDTAMKLGTALTQGWFWMRRAGCSAVYRLENTHTEFGNSNFGFGSPVCVVEADDHQISLPTYLAHEPSSTCCYIIRRFNGCGRQDRTMAAAVCVHAGADGQLAAPAPNAVFGASFEVRNSGFESGHVACLKWSYWPLDQEAAPRAFNIYWDGGTGEIDFANAIAVLPYKGGKFYSHQSQPLDDGRYLFALRAESTVDAESPPKAIAGCEIRNSAPGQAVILEGEAI
jgi:hypothetical protein